MWKELWLTVGSNRFQFLIENLTMKIVRLQKFLLDEQSLLHFNQETYHGRSTYEQ